MKDGRDDGDGFPITKVGNDTLPTSNPAVAMGRRLVTVMPAEAGIQETRNEPWIPVCTGMTAMDSREQMWGMTNFLRHVPGGRHPINWCLSLHTGFQTFLFRNLGR